MTQPNQTKCKPEIGEHGVVCIETQKGPKCVECGKLVMPRFNRDKPLPCFKCSDCGQIVCVCPQPKEECAVCKEEIEAGTTAWNLKVHASCGYPIKYPQPQEKKCCRKCTFNKGGEHCCDPDCCCCSCPGHNQPLDVNKQLDKLYGIEPQEECKRCKEPMNITLTHSCLLGRPIGTIGIKPQKQDWEIEFEEYFVADNIMDCIPKENWEQMKTEVFGRIRQLILSETSKALAEQREETVRMMEGMKIHHLSKEFNRVNDIECYNQALDEVLSLLDKDHKKI